MAKKGKHTAPAPEAQEGKSKSLLQRLRVLLIVAAAALAVRSMIRDKKKGGSLSCGGDCSRCRGHCG